MMQLQRSKLTAELLTALEPNVSDGTSAWLVGDAKKPSNSGWQGDPGASDFVPYVVLTPLVTDEIVTSAQPGGWGSQTPVEFPYAITSIGNSRAQCEILADRARDNAATLMGTAPLGLGGDVTSVLPSRIGAIQRTDQDHGSYFVQTDVVSARVSPT